MRNEAWILRRFLECASLWADHIVVADQGSTDGSREIARGFDKVRLVENRDEAYDEGSRQRLLLAEARRIPGRRLIVALDADEALSADAIESEEWRELRHAQVGTVARFEWINLLPGGATCWIPPAPVPFAFMDDGSPHDGGRIHSTRLPVPSGAPRLDMRATKVLHLQHLVWRRMESKQRWYQCWEALNHRHKRPIQIYRQYHRMHAFPEAEIHPVRDSWLAGYERRGIDVRAVPDDDGYWDAEVLAWLRQHGPDTFRRLAIWDVDWQDAARRAGIDIPGGVVSDPRSRVERAVHSWLRRTQSRAGNPVVRLGQRALIPLGW